MEVLASLKCKSCDHSLFEIKEVMFANNIKHVGAYCSNCGKVLQWLPGTIPDQDGLTQIGEIEIPFGKHKGTKLKDLPKEYLNWIKTNTSGKFQVLSAQMLEENEQKHPGNQLK